MAALSTLILAILRYPDVQAKARAHLDQVLGKNQLPRFEDEPSLPYITAIAKEVLRWQTVTPLAVPHVVTEEDNYKGYTIPAGSIILANSWYVIIFVTHNRTAAESRH